MQRRRDRRGLYSVMVMGARSVVDGFGTAEYVAHWPADGVLGGSVVGVDADLGAECVSYCRGVGAASVVGVAE